MDTWNEHLNDGRDVTLRFLVPEDKPQLLSMVQSFSDEVLIWSNPPYDEAKINRWMTGAGTRLSIVAVHDQKIVGISSIHRYAQPRQKGLAGMMIYIHQDFRGAGLGTAMTERVLALAVETGLHRVGLEVVEDNKVAVQLYKRFGFKIEGN